MGQQYDIFNVCNVPFAVYMSCLMPTEMFQDANKLCLDELFCAIILRWILGQ